MTVCRITLVLASSLLVAACEGREQPPSAVLPAPLAATQAQQPGQCAHSETLETVRSILIGNAGGVVPERDAVEVVNAVREALATRAVPLTLDDVRTVTLDAAVGRSECVARVRLVLPPTIVAQLPANAPQSLAIGLGGWHADGAGAVAAVAYRTQLTDMQGKVHVDLRGDAAFLKGLAALAGAALPESQLPQQSRPKAGAKSQPQQATASVCGGEAAGADAARACGPHDVEEAEARITAAYRDAMGRLSEDRQAQLSELQQTWRADRDRSCQGAAASAGGGEAACLVRAATQRATELAAWR